MANKFEKPMQQKRSTMAINSRAGKNKKMKNDKTEGVAFILKMTLKT